MLNKYLTIFDNHTEYEDFIQDDVIRPNVSFCRDREKEVHYLYDAGVVKLYNGTELVASEQLDFGRNDEYSNEKLGYRGVHSYSTAILFSDYSYDFDKIQVDIRKPISDLSVLNNSNEQIQFSYTGNTITIEFEEILNSVMLYLTYKVNGKKYYSHIYVNVAT